MVLESAGVAEAFLLGRVVFGGLLAFMGVNHFASADEMAGYAESKGVPAAGVLVPLTGAMLLLGGLGVVLGAFPVLAAGALAAFLLVTTPTMHDFWTLEGEAQRTEMVNFLKNAALLGAALVLLALGTEPWPYALNVGLFL